MGVIIVLGKRDLKQTEFWYKKAYEQALEEKTHSTYKGGQLDCIFIGEQLIETYILLGKDEEASTLLTSLMAVDPQQADLCSSVGFGFNSGCSRVLPADVRRAKFWYQEGVKYNNLRCLEDLAEIYCHESNFKAAKPLLIRASEHAEAETKGSANTLTFLAEIYCLDLDGENQDNNIAIALYKKALALEKSTAEARGMSLPAVNLCSLYYTAHRHTDAQAVLKECADGGDTQTAQLFYSMVMSAAFATSTVQEQKRNEWLQLGYQPVKVKARKRSAEVANILRSLNLTDQSGAAGSHSGPDTSERLAFLKWENADLTRECQEVNSALCGFNRVLSMALDQSDSEAVASHPDNLDAATRLSQTYKNTMNLFADYLVKVTTNIDQTYTNIMRQKETITNLGQFLCDAADQITSSSLQTYR